MRDLRRLALLFVLAVLLAACGGDDDGGQRRLVLGACPDGAVVIKMVDIKFDPEDATAHTGDQDLLNNEDESSTTRWPRSGGEVQVRPVRQGRDVHDDGRQGRHGQLRVHGAPEDDRDAHHPGETVAPTGRFGPGAMSRRASLDDSFRVSRGWRGRGGAGAGRRRGGPRCGWARRVRRTLMGGEAAKAACAAGPESTAPARCGFLQRIRQIGPTSALVNHGRHRL